MGMRVTSRSWAWLLVLSEHGGQRRLLPLGVEGSAPSAFPPAGRGVPPSVLANPGLLVYDAAVPTGVR